MSEDPSEHLYEDRARALSFGGVAALYDRARPSYPPALIDALMAPSPRRVLDVGCGTGKGGAVAGRARMRRRRRRARSVDGRHRAGPRDHRRGGNVRDVGGCRPRSSTSSSPVRPGTGWIPSSASPKRGSLLRPGGHLGVFWNRGRPDEDAAKVFEDVYTRLAPGLAKTSIALNPPVEPRDRVAEFEKGGVFTEVAARAFPGPRSTTEKGGSASSPRTAITSACPTLQRRALLDALGDAVDALGGAMTYHYSTLLVLAKRGHDRRRTIGCVTTALSARRDPSRSMADGGSPGCDSRIIPA